MTDLDLLARLDEVTRTAPERIWLQVSDDEAHKDEPFPDASTEEITWCTASVTECEVEYVRADRLRLVLEENKRLAEAGKWQPMETAPKNVTLLGVVEDSVRLIRWCKTSHVPIYGWCVVDEGPEGADVCRPRFWQPLPPPPESA